METSNAKPKTLAIVGGGAAGLAASIAAAERARELGVPLAVNIYERDERVGRSILATGNGRCNFSNLRIVEREYHNAEFVHGALDALEQLAVFGGEPGSGISRVNDFFESLGLEWRNEDDGRLYPLANKASVVVDVLRAAARRLGVREVCGKGVLRVELPREMGKRFTLRMEDGVFERADAVIVACGGRALQTLDVEGLRKLKLKPVLGALRVIDEDIPFTRELDNIRVRCSVMLMRDRGDEYVPVGVERGELMFRKYGVSGICVFNLSRVARPGDLLEINLLSMSGLERAEDYLVARRCELAKRFGDDLTCEDMLRGLVLPRVAEALLKRAGIQPEATCTPKMAKELAGCLVMLTLTVAGIADPDQCQVRRGGFAVDQFDAATMGVHDAPGLFAAGEALDVDGPCGGYNLHWAWASGILAGRSAAESCL